MSWLFGSMVVVTAALVAGFCWYELNRPSSKLVAAVAALAALAVGGRVLFAAIPNVQATTDVVLLSGYALGAGPGFAIGAVGALGSNFFLGQGPWTPWQMLGWGAVGLAGAALARARRGSSSSAPPGRLALATACAIAGFAFGAWMDLFTLVTFAAERSLDGYLVVAAAGFPFNVAHAIGNALLCLLLGPSFLRLLLRFRRRFEVEWIVAQRPRAAIRGTATGGVAGTTTAVVVAVAVALSLAAADAAEGADVGRAVRYLERAQNEDGGFGGAPGQGSSELITGWTVLGLEAAGRHPLDIRRAGRNPIGFMRAAARTLGDTGELERTMLAVRGAGLSGRSFAGHDLLALLESRQRRNGSFEGQVNLTAFGILALRAAGKAARSRPIQAAVSWLSREQNADGGFSFLRRGGASDADDTGAALQALAAGKRRRAAAVARALGYLGRAQNSDGGFGQLAGSRSNAQSTAWAIQGLVAAGRDPERFRHEATRSPVRYLGSLQQADGSFRYSRTSAQTPVWVTAQAITALRGKPFPLRAPRRTQPEGPRRAPSATSSDRRSASPASSGHRRSGSIDESRRDGGRRPGARPRPTRTSLNAAVGSLTGTVPAKVERPESQSNGAASGLWAALLVLALAPFLALWLAGRLRRRKEGRAMRR
jgi:energy-coupling factor transport system substrate-specific component